MTPSPLPRHDQSAQLVLDYDNPLAGDPHEELVLRPAEG